MLVAHTSRPKDRLFSRRPAGWYLTDFARSRHTNAARAPVVVTATDIVVSRVAHVVAVIFWRLRLPAPGASSVSASWRADFRRSRTNRCPSSKTTATPVWAASFAPSGDAWEL